MDDLEQQIRALVDARVDGVAPVSPDDAWARADGPADTPSAPAPQARRRATILGLAAAAAVLVALGLAAVVNRDRPTDTVHTTQPPPTVPPTVVPDGWRVLTVPDLGWTLAAPADWGSNVWARGCDGPNGVIVSNSPVPITRVDDPTGCSTAWDHHSLARRDLVALALIDDGPNQGNTGRHPETRLPLSLDDLRPVTPSSGTTSTGTASERRVDLHHDETRSAHLEAWIGPDASAADLEVLGRIVASVRWPAAEDARLVPAAGGVGAGTFEACMADRGYQPWRHLAPGRAIAGEPAATREWGADARRSTFTADHRACTQRGRTTVDTFNREFRAWPESTGVSQSPAAAKRDRVLPEVAALPMAERAVPTAWLAAREGTWAITRPPTPNDGADCVVGDPDLPYGSGHVSLCDYAEIVLVGQDGRIDRAYPTPSSTPTWLLATKDAVFAGRVGDGGQPESTIVRIDRRTFEARVLIFPSTEGGLQTDDPRWSVAPSTAHIDDLVRVGEQVPPSDVLVESWIGVTGIDLPAVEQLFA